MEADRDLKKNGILDFYDREKGYGFIQEFTTKTKYYVHCMDLPTDIAEKDIVTFDTKLELFGLNAVHVEKLK